MKRLRAVTHHLTSKTEFEEIMPVALGAWELLRKISGMTFEKMNDKEILKNKATSVNLSSEILRNHQFWQNSVDFSTETNTCW